MDNIDLNTIPAKALNCSTRVLLGQYLNPEQELLSENNLNRDYRGLAEQMNYQYNDIRNFQRNENPTLKVLEALDSFPHSTIGLLVQFLQNMGRYDVVEDLMKKFENDAKLFLQKSLRHQQESPLQVPEITSCRVPDARLDDSDILTREDANTGKYTLYDAFLCYADEDLPFVSELARFLESEFVGFKLFIRNRDMLAGHNEYETSMQLIQERCKRVLIILSPDFLKSPACEVQASFAAGLGIDEKCRKLIPILYKPCEIPLMLKFISKIDFTKPGGIKDWIWEKLISSLQDGPSSTFISVERRYPPVCNSLSPEMSLQDSGHPAITFPPTASSSALCIASSSASYPQAAIVHEETQSDSAISAVKTSVKQKTKLQNFRFWKSPKKGDTYNGNSYSSSNATSGFHSQPYDGTESLVGLRKSSIQNTQM